MSDWQGWPLENRHSDWLDKHLVCLIGILIICGSGFSFICGVIVGLVQPPLYHLVMKWLGLG